MRCSECSHPVAPIVAVDIDGTLGAYHEHFKSFAEMYVGRKLRDEYDGSCNFGEWMGLPLELYEDIKLAYRQGGMKRSMPVYEGATELCQRIRATGAELWIATTRPFLRLDNIDPDTREWLQRNSIKYDGLVYGEDKYPRLVQLVDADRVVCVIDDLSEQIEIADRLRLPHIQVWRPHNRNKLWPPVYPNLYGIAHTVEQEITGWKQQQDQSPVTL